MLGFFYSGKFVLMAESLATNAVIITRFLLYFLQLFLKSSKLNMHVISFTTWGQAEKLLLKNPSILLVPSEIMSSFYVEVFDTIYISKLSSL